MMGITVGVHNPAGGEERARVTANPTGSPIVAVWFLYIPHFTDRPGVSWFLEMRMHSIAENLMCPRFCSLPSLELLFILDF